MSFETDESVLNSEMPLQRGSTVYSNTHTHTQTHTHTHTHTHTVPSEEHQLQSIWVSAYALEYV